MLILNLAEASAIVFMLVNILLNDLTVFLADRRIIVFKRHRSGSVLNKEHQLVKLTLNDLLNEYISILCWC